jgi:dihydroxy-acid dehydratase
VALLTDGRFSAARTGLSLVHITPEAQEGGPIALVHDGDRIVIDSTACELRVDVTDAELTARRKAWSAPPPKATGGCWGSTCGL